jgi:hypothetical protein
MSKRFLAGLPLFLVFAAPCPAQTDQNPPAANPDATAKTSPGSTNAAPPKKVWTNDDIHKGTGVSVVGDRRNQNYHMSPQQTADAATVSRIRASLEKLNAQLDDTNQRLAGLKTFAAGEPVREGGQQIDKGINRVPIDQQIHQLEASKKKLEMQIGDLLDEARKKGIDPGQLR